MENANQIKKVSTLVDAWFAGEHTMFDSCTEEPEIAWQAILEISQRDLTDEQRALLAGGPLETLLSWHGGSFIDRVVDEAKRSPRFRHLLGGVWRQDMPEEIWERIIKLRKDVW
ncbi:MAG: hypothetical protein DME19_04275 [Verrucomicrobia bacterium]|nr:MAG: hypothetical protein DME19_04275 [Verrucomicrobiota bacterium]